jgi:hypothetical protein
MSLQAHIGGYMVLTWCGTRETRVLTTPGYIYICMINRGSDESWSHSSNTQAPSRTRDHMQCMWMWTQDGALLSYQGVDGAFLPCLCVPASISSPLSQHPLPGVDACLLVSSLFLFYLLFFTNNLPVPMPPPPTCCVDIPPACHVNAPLLCQHPCLPHQHLPHHVNTPAARYLKALPARCINAPPTCCVDVAPCSLLHRRPPAHCINAPWILCTVLTHLAPVCHVNAPSPSTRVSSCFFFTYIFG